MLKLTVLGLLAGSVLGLSAVAANADAKTTATQQCIDGIRDEVSSSYRNAYNVGSYDPKTKKVNNAGDYGVSGIGQFDNNRGRVTEFSFRCFYNVRNHETYGISVRLRGAQPPPAHQSQNETGAIVGGIIAGAIVQGLAEHQRRHHHHQDAPDDGEGAMAGAPDPADDGNGAMDGSRWSPSKGVDCDSNSSSCYSGGQYSPEDSQHNFSEYAD